MSSKENKLRYPFDEHPKAGTTVELAPGVRWLTMPMPGSLAHINLYLLEAVSYTHLTLPTNREV